MSFAATLLALAPVLVPSPAQATPALDGALRDTVRAPRPRPEVVDISRVTLGGLRRLLGLPPGQLPMRQMLVRGAGPVSVVTVLGSGAGTLSSSSVTPTIGGVSSSSAGLGGPPVMTPGFRLVLSIFVPATGQRELFSFFRPNLFPGQKRPMMVHFHQFNTSPVDLIAFTDFLTQARNREWFVVAPVQAGPPTVNPTISYAVVHSQLHVEAVMDWVLTMNSEVDLDRIFGYGFSMGGGNAMSYAARHLDRTRGAFAAVVNHTGTVCVPDVWENANSNGRATLELLFGGTPAQVPFEYLRSSTVDLDVNGDLDFGGRHMAVNIEQTPIQTWYAANDPEAELRNQCDQLDVFMQALPFSDHTLIVRPGTTHSWDLLDEDAVCNWFDTQFLTVPNRGQLLIDRDGVYWDFQVEQLASGRFSSMSWLSQNNSLSIAQTDNLRALRFRTADVGIDETQPHSVIVNTIDQNPVLVVFEAYFPAPTQVLLDGAVPPAGSWGYNANDFKLVLEAPDGAGHVWSIQ